MGALIRAIFAFWGAQVFTGWLRKICERKPNLVEQPTGYFLPQVQQEAGHDEPPVLPGDAPFDDYEIEIYPQPHADPDLLDLIRIVEDDQL